jgi:hypothetical protein
MMDLCSLGGVGSKSPLVFILKKIEKASLSTLGLREHRFSQSNLGNMGITLNNFIVLMG